MYRNLPVKVSVSEVKKEIGSYFKVFGWNYNHQTEKLSSTEENLREKLYSMFNRGFILMNSSFPIVLNSLYELFSGKLKSERFADIFIEERLFKSHFYLFGDDEKRNLFETTEKAEEDIKGYLFLVLEDFIEKNNKVGFLRTKEIKEKHAFLVDMLNNRDNVELSSFLNVKKQVLFARLIEAPRCWMELFGNGSKNIYSITNKGEMKEFYSDIYSVEIDEETNSLSIKFESTENNIIGSFNHYRYNVELNCFSFDNSHPSSPKKYLTENESKEELKNIIERLKKEIVDLSKKL